MDIGAIRSAIARGITVPGWHCYRAFGESTLELPALVVGQAQRIKYSKTYAGTAELTLVVMLVVSRASDTVAQDTLDKALSVGQSTSVVDAFYGLEGPWTSLELPEGLTGEPYAATADAANVVVAELELTIRARRDQV